MEQYDLYLRYLTDEKKYSMHTVKAYASDLHALLSYFQFTVDTSFRLNELSYPLIRNYIAYLGAHGLSAALISEAESNNNYRLAIRYYYLWLLKGLSEKEIIDYDPEKTNSDYQYEIKTPEISEQFAYTSICTITFGMANLM